MDIAEEKAKLNEYIAERCAQEGEQDLSRLCPSSSVCCRNSVAAARAVFAAAQRQCI